MRRDQKLRLMLTPDVPEVQAFLHPVNPRRHSVLPRDRDNPVIRKLLLIRPPRLIVLVA
jgi:hypothetical protein